MGTWHMRVLLALLATSMTQPASAQAREQEDEPSVWFRDLERARDLLSSDQAPRPLAEQLAPPELEPLEVDALEADPRALIDFRPVLDPNGEWHQHAQYGLVWIPHRHLVGDEFAPYLTHGRWALDTAGNWVWVSDFSFGPVVFHYGRWVWITGLGWSWVPGYRYAPAWVIWRVPAFGSRMLGWAPLPPAFVWVGGFAVGIDFYVTTPWVFCPSRHVFSRRLDRHRLVGREKQHWAARHTRVYEAPRGRSGPPPAMMGVPADKLPPRRVPTQPTAPVPRASSRWPSAGSATGSGRPAISGGSSASTGSVAPPLPRNGGRYQPHPRPRRAQSSAQLPARRQPTVVFGQHPQPRARARFDAGQVGSEAPVVHREVPESAVPRSSGKRPRVRTTKSSASPGRPLPSVKSKPPVLQRRTAPPPPIERRVQPQVKR